MAGIRLNPLNQLTARSYDSDEAILVVTEDASPEDAEAVRVALGVGTTDSPTFDSLTVTGPSYFQDGSFTTVETTSLFFDAYEASGGATFTYNGTSASDHRIALGLGTTDAPTFGNATFSTGSIATSQPLTLTQTWTNTATTYTGLQVNVTDSGPSNAASLLMDLQVGGVSKFKVDKAGILTVAESSAYNQATALRYSGSNSGISFTSGDLTSVVSNGIGVVSFKSNAGLLIKSTLPLSWSTSEVNGATDMALFRDATGTLAQRNGTAAQTSRLYDTYTSATDYHRLAISTARATATAMSGASVTLTNIIPAGAVVVGITCKVTTAITGATSFQLGTAADPDRFGATIAIAAGTTSDNRDWTSGTVECFPAATSLILTANGSNFTAGAVYVSVQYLSGQAD